MIRSKGLLASGFYKFIRMLEYETANPGQDFDDQEHEFFDPSKDTSRPIVNLAPDGSTQIIDETIPSAHEPHPGYSAGPGGHVSGEATSSEARYHYGPDIEAAKASPRQS
ncbi:MAG: hypothetical protein Q9173_004960 [Seirophora scorigena]